MKINLKIYVNPPKKISDNMRQGITLDDWQKEVLDTEGNIVLRSGRQVGKSTIISMKAAKYAMNNKRSRILIIAATDRQSKRLLQMVLRNIEKKNDRMIKKGKEKPTQHKIKLKNGSIIRSYPAGRTGYGIRGYTLDLLIADEAAFINEEVWQAVTPMVAMTGGDIWLISTPHGKEGYFYDCFTDENFKSFHISTEEILEKDNRPEEQKTELRKHLEAERKRMTEMQYAQEYLGEFVDKLRQFFSDKLMKEVCSAERREDKTRRNKKYFLGCDVAGLGEDETTIEILEKTPGDKLIHVENIIKKKQKTTEISDFIKSLDRNYNFAKIGVDDAGIGFGVWSELREDNRTKRRTVALNNRRRSTGEESGTKKLMKEEMYMNLKNLMEKKDIQLLNDDEVIQSLKSIQYEYSEGENQKSRMRVFGSYTHIAEGLIRAAWLADKSKTLNVFAHKF